MSLPKRLTLLVLLIIVIPTTGCRTSDGLRRDYLRSLAPLLSPPTRPVVIIPGFGVSRLYDTELEQWVWGTPRTTVITGYDDDLDLPVSSSGELAHDSLIPRGFAGSRGSVNTAWQLAVALQKFGGYRVARWNHDAATPSTAYLFEYDWRRSAFDNAVRLDEMIESIRTEHGDRELRVDLLTHSAGANIALAYLGAGTAGRNDPAARQAELGSVTEKVDRLVMIAPPRRGTPEAFRILVRGETVIRRRLDPVMAATWPAVAEILPHDGFFLVDSAGESMNIDLHDIDSWRSLRIGLFDPVISADVTARQGKEGWKRRVQAFERSLAQSARLRRLENQPLPDGLETLTIMGDCVPTVRKVLMRPDRSFVFYRHELKSAEKHLIATLFEPGDGTVGSSSAAPHPGEEQVPLCSGHQGLSMDPAAQRAVLRALLQ